MSVFKAYAVGILAVLLVTGFLMYTHHERAIEHAKDVAADDKALATRHTEVQAETKENIAKADAADAGAKHDQQVIDDYLRNHPVGVVRVCRRAPSDREQGMPTNQAADGSPPGPGAGQPTIRPMPDGNAGPDIGPGLDELVSAASRLAVIDAQRQRRDAGAQPVK